MSAACSMQWPACQLSDWRNASTARSLFFPLVFLQGYAAQVDTNTEWVYLVGRVPVSGLPTRLEKLPAAAPAAA
jgi:hypothetical protein